MKLQLNCLLVLSKLKISIFQERVFSVKSPCRTALQPAAGAVHLQHDLLHSIRPNLIPYTSHTSGQYGTQTEF